MPAAKRGIRDGNGKRERGQGKGERAKMIRHTACKRPDPLYFHRGADAKAPKPDAKRRRGGRLSSAPRVRAAITGRHRRFAQGAQSHSLTRFPAQNESPAEWPPLKGGNGESANSEGNSTSPTKQRVRDIRGKERGGEGRIRARPLKL